MKKAESSKLNGKKGGRPIGSFSARSRARQEAEAMFVREAAKHLPEIVEALVEAARGMWVEVRKEGKLVRVYRKSADVQAIKEYLDRIMGKPTQPIGFETPEDFDMSMQALKAAEPFLNHETTRADTRVDGSAKGNTKKRSKGVDRKNATVKKKSPDLR